MNNYQRALSGYSNSAGEINQNLGNWRSDIDNVAAGNKAGLQRAIANAKEQVDFNALTGIGEEFAIRGAKEYGGKLLGKIYNKTGLKSLDQKAGKFLQSKFRDLTGQGQQVSGQSQEDVEDSGEGVELDDMEGGDGTGGGDLVQADPGDESRMGGGEEDEGDMDFGEFMDTQTTQGGGLDYADREYDLFGHTDNEQHWSNTGEENPNLMAQQDNAEAVRSEPQTEQVAQNEGSDVRNQAGENETKEGEEGEDAGDTGVDATNPTEGIENATGEADDAVSNVVNDAADTAGNLVSDGAKALSTGVDSAIGDGLEAAGAALDMTGALAPLGVLAQVAGGVLEAGSIYQMGEGLVNWWDTAILGEKPKVDFKATKAPVAPQTLATRGLMAAPTMDSNFDVPSTAGGW